MDRSTIILVDNGYTFCGTGKMIEVRAYEDSPQLGIEVVDTAPGIPAADRPHVWEEL